MSTAGEGVAQAPSVGVLVTTYNGQADTMECLRSIVRSRYPRLRVLVMDDASADGTAEAIRREFPQVDIVTNARNLGYIPNVNRGTDLLRDTDYILILNNDVTTSEDLVERLVEVAQSDARIALCGPQMFLHSSRRTVWAAGGRISPWTWRSSHHYQGHPENGLYSPMEVDYIPAAAMLVRTRAFREIGLFEPAYEAYFEDADFCLRLREAGWRVLCVPRAKIWHKVSATMQKILAPEQLKYLGVRNRRWCQRAHAPAARRPLLQAIDLLVSALQFAWNLALVSPRAAGAIFRGYCAGWRPMPNGRGHDGS